MQPCRIVEFIPTIRLGGYVTHTTTFYPRGVGTEPASSEPFSVVLFTATPENDLWLGEAPLGDIARQGLISIQLRILTKIFMKKLPKMFTKKLSKSDTKKIQ